MASNEKLSILKAILAEMIDTDESITARAVVRKLPHIFKNPSAITRDNKERRQVLEEAIIKQKKFRSFYNSADMKTRKSLKYENANLKNRVACLEKDRDILIASHRAMIRSVGEIGGMRGWSAFFENYNEVVQRLYELRALPDDQPEKLLVINTENN